MERTRNQGENVSDYIERYGITKNDMSAEESKAFSESYMRDFSRARNAKKKFEQKIFVMKPEIKSEFVDAPTTVKWYLYNEEAIKKYNIDLRTFKNK